MTTKKQKLYCEAIRLDVALYHKFIANPNDKTRRLLDKSQKRCDRRDRIAAAEFDRSNERDTFTDADPGL